jgi:hypothetical protein
MSYRSARIGIRFAAGGESRSGCLASAARHADPAARFFGARREGERRAFSVARSV